MLDKLQKRWKVSGVKFVLILCVFAITGFTTAYISKMITGWVGLTPTSALWKRALLRGAVLLIGYQFVLLTVSIPLGQFSFFWKYEKKLLQRLKILPPNKSTKDPTQI